MKFAPRCFRTRSLIGDSLTIHLNAMVQVRSLVTLQNIWSNAPFSLRVEGENQSGIPTSWNICDFCTRGFIDLNNVESPGAGLKINKVEFQGGSPTDSRLDICEVFAFEGRNISEGSTVLAATPETSTASKLPYVLDNSASLSELFGPDLII